MEEILKVQNLKKSFKLSKKQQMLEKTNLAVKVAVNDLSFTAYKGETAYSVQTARARRQRS